MENIGCLYLHTSLHFGVRFFYSRPGILGVFKFFSLSFNTTHYQTISYQIISCNTMQFYAIPCNVIQYLTLREHLCPSARRHFNPLKKISHLFIRFCAMDQYNSPYRDLQKESWSEGRRCRYWAVSDVSLSQPIPKVKRWLIVEHSFVFFSSGEFQLVPSALK